MRGVVLVGVAIGLATACGGNTDDSHPNPATSTGGASSAQGGAGGSSYFSMGGANTSATTVMSLAGGQSGSGGAGGAAVGGAAGTATVTISSSVKLPLPVARPSLLTLNISYGQVQPGISYHVELCAGDVDEITGTWTTRSDVQSFGIEPDMSALDAVKSAYRQALGPACDLAYLVGPLTGTEGTAISKLRIIPPALSPPYNYVRLRPFFYNSDSQTIEFCMQQGAETYLILFVE